MINSGKKTFLILLVAVGFITVFDLFHPGLPLTHDGKDHVARIANFYENLQQGILIPRWAPNLNWGYGHPILEFLYPLPSYFASLFHSIGFSLIDATKIVYGIGMIGSGVAMYFWLAEFLAMPAAFIGGVLYMFTPYRFVELYVRGDIGENLAFAFMPLTLFFIYRFFKQKKIRYLFYSATSLACLILAHNAISLMYLPFLLFYLFYLVLQAENRKQKLRQSCILLLLGFGLAAFFWIPGLLEAKYTLRNIVTAGAYTSRFVTFPQLLYGPWSYGISGIFTVQLGIVNWIMFLLGALAGYGYWKRKDYTSLLILCLVLYTVVAIFLMLPVSNFIWQKIMLLQNFQFPWRFLAIPLFTTTVLCGIVVDALVQHLPLVQKRYNTGLLRYARNDIFVFLFVLLILFCNKDYWRANGYFYKNDAFFTGVYDGTTDTGESAPIWSVRFMEHRYLKPMQVISGKADITPLLRTATKHVYMVDAQTPVGLLENTLYFPGWQIRVDDQLVTIQYQDPHHRGLMTFAIPKGKHLVAVTFSETKLRALADLISLLTLLIVVGWSCSTYMTKVSHLQYNKKKL